MAVPIASVVGVLTEAQMQPFLAKLNKTKGVDLLSAPRVTTRSGQRAVIEIIREFKYPVWKKSEEKGAPWLTDKFETRNVGVTLEVEPTLGMDSTIDLRLIPQVVEHLGFIDVENGKPVKSASADPIRKAGARTGTLQPLSRAAIEATVFEPGARTSILQPMGPGSGRLRPVFSTRKVTTDISIFSGNSVIISGVGETEEIKPFKPRRPGRQLIVIITARQITP